MAIGIECAGLTLLSGVVGYLGLGAWWVCLVGGGNGGGEGGLFFGNVGGWMGLGVVLSVGFVCVGGRG